MSLLDKVWTDLHNQRIWKNMPDPARQIYRDHYAQYRRYFSQARAFNISNKALETAYDLSNDQPEALAKRLFMARLPFPKVWIEYDLIHKTAYASRDGHNPPPVDSTPERIGWLIMEDPSDPLRWVMTTWLPLDPNDPKRGSMENQVTVTANAWLLDTANRTPPEKIGDVIAVDPRDISEHVKLDNFDMDDLKYRNATRTAFSHLGWGYAPPIDEYPDHRDRMRKLGLAEPLANSLNVGWEPLSAQVRKNSEFEMMSGFIDTCVECRGDVRMAVTLLSLINEVPVELSSTQRSGTLSGPGGIRKKYLVNNTVTINIPSKRPLRQIRQIFSSKIKSHKARHEVRGHWRKIVHKRDHTRKIKQPDGSIEEVFFAKGQVEHVWVNSHERGDATYGYVKHSYVVEKRG